jgi:hypothetical protein
MRTTKMKLTLLFSSLLLTVAVGCAGEQAPVDDDPTTDESELRGRAAEFHVTYGYEYAQKGVTVTFELNPSSPERGCAPEVRVVPREERTMTMDSNQRRYQANVPTRGGCLYDLRSISFEVECIPHPRRQCLEGTSLMHVFFADPNGVDYDEWRIGEVMGTDGRSERHVLVLPTDVREGATAFSSLWDLDKIYYFQLRSGY